MWADKSVYSSLSHMARLPPAAACPPAQILPVARPTDRRQAAHALTHPSLPAPACPAAPLLPVAVIPVRSRGPPGEHRRAAALALLTNFLQPRREELHHARDRPHPGRAVRQPDRRQGKIRIKWNPKHFPVFGA